MKYFSIILISFLMIFSTAFSGPKLEIIGGSTYDWGKVKYSDNPLEAKIKLKNVGDEQLIISDVKPGCGCTTAPLDKDKLKPGETATMDVKLKVSKRAGNITKSISITTNDPAQQRTILYIKADVEMSLEIGPTQYFTFKDMTVGVEQDATLTIKNASNKDIRLFDIDSKPENMKVNLTNNTVIKPGKEVSITAKVVPDKKGYFNCTLLMKTTDPDFPELRIHGYGNVKESPVFNN